jgi:hypothetical protein
LIEFDVLPERVGLAEMTKYFDARVESLRQMILSRPAMPKTQYEATQWTRAFVSYYGKVLGALEFAVEFGHMPAKMQRQIEQKVKRMLQYHMGTLLIGK